MRLATLGSILIVAGCGKTLPQSLEVPLGGFGRDASSSGSPVEMGPRDLGRPDLSALADMGSRIDGGLDTGPEDVAPPDMGMPSCDLGAIEIQLSSDRNSSYSGRARLASLSPIQFRVGRETFSVILGARTPEPRGLEVGEIYEIFLRVRPNGPSQDVILFVQSPETAGVSYAIWRASELEFQIFEYGALPCGPDANGCGEQQALEMLVENPETGRTERLRPGQRTFVGGYDVANGPSYLYAAPPDCEGVPERLYTGVLRIADGGG